MNSLPRSILPLLLLSPSILWAAGPPALLSPAQRDRLELQARLLLKADAFRDRGQARDALSSIRQALDLDRAVFGQIRLRHCERLRSLAAFLEQRQQWELARESWHLNLTVLRVHLDDQHWQVVDARLDLADGLLFSRLPPHALAQLRTAEAHTQEALALRRAFRSASALERAEQALERRKEVLGDQHRLVASSLVLLAELLHETNQSGRALVSCERARAIRAKILGTRHPEYAAVLHDLAALLQSVGKVREALPLLEQTLALRKELLGEEHSHYATTLNNLAALYWRQGDYRNSIATFQRTLSLLERLQEDRHPPFVASLNNLAVLHRRMGDYPLALPLLKRALDICRSHGEDQHPYLALTLHNLAEVHRSMGEHRLALPLLQEALRLREARVRERPAEFASSLQNLAALHQSMGEYRLALPLSRQAHRILHELHGPRHRETIGCLTGMGSLYHAMKEYHQALPYFQEAVRLGKELDGESHADQATRLNNLAVVHHDLRQFEQALPLLTQALEIRRKALGNKHPHYATSLNNLASFYQDQHDHARALTLFQEALDLRKEILGDRHPHYASSLDNLGSLYYAMGKRGAAVALSGQALAISQRFYRETSTALSDGQRLLLLEDLARFLHHFLSWAGDDLPPATLYEACLGFKGAFSSNALESRLANDGPGTRQALVELRDVRTMLAQLADRAMHQRLPPGWQKRFDALEQRQASLEQQLATRSAGFARFRQKPTAAAVTDALPAGCGLVEFVVYHDANEDPTTDQKDSRRVLAFILRPEHPPLLVRLGRARRLEHLVQQWRASAILHHTPDPALANSLRRLVWDPLARHLDGIQTVLIAPDGELSGLPFAALPGNQPGTFLLHQYAFGQVPSGRLLMVPPPRSATRPARGLLALGGVDFGTRPSDAPRSSRNWKNLRGAGLEAHQVEAAYHRAFPSDPTITLRGAEASKTGLLDKLGKEPRWRYLHLATHGFYDRPRGAMPAAILGAWAVGAGGANGLSRVSGALTGSLVAQEPGVLDRDRGFDPTGRADRIFARNPLTTTGLVLANANRSETEGLLSALEVSSLDLSGCELATSSACESGLGAVQGWQGVLGLQQGFHDAGARNVLSSLWNVDDAATSLLMEDFYDRLWSKKLPPLEALRQAQLTLLQNPARVLARRNQLIRVLGPRGLGDEPVQGPPIPGEGNRGTIPVAWWAAWVLSGTPGR